MRIHKNSRRFILFTALLFSLYGMAGAEETWLWPLRGARHGSDIILRPSSIVRNEYRKVDEPLGHFVIAAPVGSEVQAVADGIIQSCGFSFQKDHITSYGDSDYKALVDIIGKKNPEAVKWIGYSISIRLYSGVIVNYHNLQAPPARTFSTGDKISRGDFLGLSAYSYKSVPQPSLAISCDRAERSVDPSLWLFGTVDSALAEKKGEMPNFRKHKHEASVLRGIFDTAWKALQEGHPALYEYISQEDLKRAFAETKSKIGRPMSSDEYFKIVQPFIALIRDNHCYVERSYARGTAENYKPQSVLPVRIGFFTEGCFLLPGAGHRRSKPVRIEKIDGESVKEIRSRLAGYVGSGDGYIESWAAKWLSDIGFHYILDKDLEPGNKILVGFTDGGEELFTVQAASGSRTSAPPFETKMLEGGIAYLKVRGMYFKDSDKTALAQWFAGIEHEGVDRLILDLRGNMGGEVGDSCFIYSFFAEKPFLADIERRVNSIDGFDFASGTTNLIPGESLYSGYMPAKDGKGYAITRELRPDAFPLVQPRSEGHFDGMTCVLTNGFTGSAAVALGSFFRRDGRGVIIGEEGANGFHAMNALDFGLLRMGNTGLILRIPLVRCVFERDGKSGVPHGRGLIPDHRIIYTAEDVAADRNLELELAIRLCTEKCKTSNVF